MFPFQGCISFFIVFSARLLYTIKSLYRHQIEGFMKIFTGIILIIKSFIFYICFLPFISHGAYQNFPIEKELSLKEKGMHKNKEGVSSYAVLSVGSVFCVTSLDGKPHLLPKFTQPDSPSAKSQKISINEEALSDSLNLPLCTEAQEIFIASQTESMKQQEELKNTLWGQAYWVVANGIACVSSFYAGKYTTEGDHRADMPMFVAFASFLLPKVLKAPLVCGGLGVIVAYFNISIENIEEDKEEAFAPSEQTVTKHKLLDPVVTVYRYVGKEELGSFDIATILAEGHAKGKKYGSGSGFFIDTDKVVTNYHVATNIIRKKEYKTVQLEVELANGKVLPVTKILAQDKKLDLVVLQVEGYKGAVVKMGDSNQLNLLDEVIVSGSPLGIKNTLTKGYVSQFRKLRGQDVIQYTSPTSPGNSGGALFLESSQEIIGVPFIAVVRSSAQNINFAIPINTIKDFLNKNNISYF